MMSAILEGWSPFSGSSISNTSAWSVYLSSTNAR